MESVLVLGGAEPSSLSRGRRRRHTVVRRCPLMSAETGPGRVTSPALVGARTPHPPRTRVRAAQPRMARTRRCLLNSKIIFFLKKTVKFRGRH